MIKSAALNPCREYASTKYLPQIGHDNKPIYQVLTTLATALALGDMPTGSDDIRQQSKEETVSRQANNLATPMPDDQWLETTGFQPPKSVI